MRLHSAWRNCQQYPGKLLRVLMLMAKSETVRYFYQIFSPQVDVSNDDERGNHPYERHET